MEWFHYYLWVILALNILNPFFVAVLQEKPRKPWGPSDLVSSMIFGPLTAIALWNILT